MLLPDLGRLSVPRGYTDRIFLSAAATHHAPLACLHSQFGAHLRLLIQAVIDILILLLAPGQWRNWKLFAEEDGKEPGAFSICLATEM